MSQESSRLAAWSDGASVQVIAVESGGDPMDLSVEEARAFLLQLQKAIEEAEG